MYHSFNYTVPFSIILLWTTFISTQHGDNPALPPSLVSLPGGDSRILLSHGATEQRRLQDREAPADGLRPPQQLSVRGAAPLAHLPRAGLHHQGVHETGR